MTIVSYDAPTPTQHPNLAARIQHISEIMPHVLDRYGLSLENEPVSERPAMASDAADLMDVMIACLESATADLHPAYCGELRGPRGRGQASSSANTMRKSAGGVSHIFDLFA